MNELHKAPGMRPDARSALKARVLAEATADNQAGSPDAGSRDDAAGPVSHTATYHDPYTGVRIVASDLEPFDTDQLPHNARLVAALLATHTTTDADEQHA